MTITHPASLSEPYSLDEVAALAPDWGGLLPSWEDIGDPWVAYGHITRTAFDQRIAEYAGYCPYTGWADEHTDHRVALEYTWVIVDRHSDGCVPPYAGADTCDCTRDLYTRIVDQAHPLAVPATIAPEVHDTSNWRARWVSVGGSCVSPVATGPACPECGGNLLRGPRPYGSEGRVKVRATHHRPGGEPPEAFEASARMATVPK